MARRFGTLEDAAAMMGVSTKTIQRRIADGTITAYRLGSRTVRIDLDELPTEVRVEGPAA